ncbi:LTA synthase family protein [uncultured Sunxiuqinia sp.]|uniref:LTA synthase family protein n=1 Tax=uncultured Sunxiuqinia sp. TaxID=1573825 RepID=UPI0026046E6F|nr:LTA synthase family protein [uncultured Sunxiuqinia sp.]
MKLKGRRTNFISDAVSQFGGYLVVLLGLMFLLRVFEFLSGPAGQALASGGTWRYYFSALYFDLVYVLFISPILFVVFLLCYWRSAKLAKTAAVVLFSLVVLGHGLLVQYFSTALNLLGADLFHYSAEEISQTAGAALTGSMVLGVVFGLLVVVLLFVFIPQHFKLHRKLATALLTLSVLCFLFIGIAPASPKADFGSEYLNNAVENKSAFFYNEAYYYLSGQEQHENLPLFADFYLGYDGKSNSKGMATFVYPDVENYPFLREDNSVELFSSFLRKEETPPNVVVIVIEGLGRAFSNENAYMGSFTPFLDSLSNHSLYWENCLSTSGRTFSVLPSLLASLPFGEHGFTEMGKAMPPHQSLISLLRHNGYDSRFLYAGDAQFDQMNVFIQKQGCDELIDKNNFGSGYKLLPENASGFSWGYGDFELYRRFFHALDNSSGSKPEVNVLLTVATHSPFLVNNQEHYKEQFNQLLPTLGLDEQMEAICRNYQQQLETVLYMDDALRNFFEAYRQRDEFENTLFVITGDHRMPDIPMSTKIDRYHVPLIVYSPLIERPAKFSSVVSHFDFTPSMMAYFKEEFDFQIPELTCWVGAGLDSISRFSNRDTYPLMQTKMTISDLVSGEHFLNDGKLYRIEADMALVEEDDPELVDRLRLDLLRFKNKNSQFVKDQKLYPDSIIARY